MQSSYWGYWLVAMGVAIVGLMISVQGITTNTTQDSYAIREIVDASMLEAVDYGYYRDYNEVKINKEKFMEVFLRMTTEVMGANDTYQVNFYAIYEAPPKVSVEIRSNSGTNFISAGDYDTVSRIDAIIQIHAEEVGSTGGSGNNNNNNDNDNDEDPGGAEEDPSTEELACEYGINRDTELAGMGGLAMKSSPIYDNYEFSESSRTINADGSTFTILGIGYDDYRWAVEYNGECGWVDATFMAINLRDYLSGMVNFNITNASSSIFRTSGETIPNVTGRALYTSEFNSFVPLTYTFAKTVKTAAQNALNAGDRLVVYDAYRPSSVSRYVNSNFRTFVDSRSDLKANLGLFNSSGGLLYGIGYEAYIADTSIHNYGCAIDVSLTRSGMPTMHELSQVSNKYNRSTGLGEVRNNFTSYMESNAGAIALYEYFGGTDDIYSEWWHYQSKSCRDAIGTPANFWSAV